MAARRRALNESFLQVVARGEVFFDVVNVSVLGSRDQVGIS